jgi:hypothetical protein
MDLCARDGCRRARTPLFGRRVTGVSIDDVWFCSSTCVEPMARARLLAAPAADGAADDGLRMRLGAWLVHNGTISTAQLGQALEAQAVSGLRLGAQVQVLGFASADAVLRALAQQAGVRYLARLDPMAVRRGPGGLDRNAVRALGLVPFREPSHGVVAVACPAPLPRLALGALRRLTGLAPEPHLVGDDVWTELVDAYGTDASVIGISRFLRTADVSEAARSIARAAMLGQAVRLTDARCDPFTWVRVASAGGAHDVVLATAEGH